MEATTKTAYNLAIAVAEIARLVASANDDQTRLSRLELLEELVERLGSSVRRPLG